MKSDYRQNEMQVYCIIKIRMYECMMKYDNYDEI